MKKVLAAIIAVALAMHPAVCLAAYIIHLKNGREFVTKQYWEEGKQILFKKYGGVVGIQKNLVKNIEETDDLRFKKAVAMIKQHMFEAEEAAGEGGAASGQKEGANILGNKADEEGHGIDVAYYKNEKKELLERYKATKKKLNDAIINHDDRLRWEAKKEIKEINEKLTRLIRELKTVNSGVLPKWWHSKSQSQ